MGIPELFTDKEERNDFFHEVTRLLRERLNPDLRHFKTTFYTGKNYIRFSYSGQSAAFYEFQFATSRSKQHTAIFGEGDHEVLAFYYGGSRIEKRKAWLQTIEPYIDSIRSQLGKEVFHGGWGENKDWTFIAVELTENDLGCDVDRYANAIVAFIEATHYPISKTFQAIS